MTSKSVHGPVECALVLYNPGASRFMHSSTIRFFETHAPQWKVKSSYIAGIDVIPAVHQKLTQKRLKIPIKQGDDFWGAPRRNKE